MTSNSAGKDPLENAYKLQTPADNSACCDIFAPTYNTDFANFFGWFHPKAIAEIFNDGF